jgi:predicted alpha/beta-hydrolase family hydrolase
MIAIDTPHGPGQAELRPVDAPKGAVVLGHGAGGGFEAPDLVAATAAANEVGFTVALVLQPYRVAGKRSQPVPAKLDEAWVAAVQELHDGALGGLPLVSGGRSAGARVACRTAAETGAAAVLCLAFPVHPPGKPEKSRIDELDGVEVPVLVVQGESDPFGMPHDAPGREVVRVRGNHGLKADPETLGEAVRRWLPTVVA